MASTLLTIGFTLFLLVGSSMLCDCNAFSPADNYLIDCGSLVNTTVDNRVFLADVSLSSSLATSSNIFANTTANSVTSFESSFLYQTARIFIGPSSYSFPILKQGRHFIRLYFFPFVYQSYDLTSVNFSVSTQQFILLSNFQATNRSVAEFKEYSMYINTDTLILTFTPMGKSSLAFINAIEVVSVPDDLISDSAQTLNPIGSYNGLTEQVFETIHRINMGGLPVSSAQDTLWRSWRSDQSFLINKNAAKFYSFTGTINYFQGGATKDTAPELVYSTATELVASNTSLSLHNVTWEFDVDTSFPLMIRLHFCDIVSKVLNQLYFNVYINGLIGIQDLDLSTLTTNTLAAAYYVDFFLRPSNGSGKVRVSIGPSTLANVQPDGILNGLEMLKINTSMASFDGQVSIVSKNGSKRKLAILLGSLLGAFLVVVIAVFLLWVLSKRRKMLRNYLSKTWLRLSNFKDGIDSPVSKCSNGTTHQNALGLHFPFAVLQEATNNFDEDWVIGVGGFGNVYKGELKDKTKVAVKRGNSKSHQGITEFYTEIEFLSQLRHRHLVSLIGYCEENNEMILVYEFMENGTLKGHLYGLGLPPLSWKQRLEICIGSAKGVHYLHTGSAKAIIHRDIKSANILLDENLMAKVADFGLSKAGPDLDETHVTTAVKGSFGYLDPEYFRMQRLTEKSDVYSFGVVLLEVLCARPVIDPTLPRELINMTEWAMRCLNKGQIEQIIDPHLSGLIRNESLEKFVETAVKCLADYGVDRPTMGDVLWSLEYALQLQGTMPTTSKMDSLNEVAQSSLGVHEVKSDQKDNLADASMSNVFSQLMKSEGSSHSSY